MRRLILPSILALMALAACTEMGRVPESEMQKSYGTYGHDSFVRRGY